MRFYSKNVACFMYSLFDLLKLYHYYWLGGSDSDNSSGTCYRTTVKTSSAVSPAFVIDGKSNVVKKKLKVEF